MIILYRTFVVRWYFRGKLQGIAFWSFLLSLGPYHTTVRFAHQLIQR